MLALTRCANSIAVSFSCIVQQPHINTAIIILKQKDVCKLSVPVSNKAFIYTKRLGTIAMPAESGRTKQTNLYFHNAHKRTSR